MIPFSVRAGWLALLTLAACSDPAPSTGNARAEQAAKARAAAERVARRSYVRYGDPVDFDSTAAYFYQPVLMEAVEQDSEGSFESSYSKGRETPLCFNLVFFHKQTGRAHLLLPHGRYLLTGVNNQEGARLPQRFPYIFYEVVKADTNHDGRLNSQDLHSLFVSDKTGHGFRQLTPDSLGLRSWQLFPDGRPGLLAEMGRPVKSGDEAGELEPAGPNSWLRFDLENLAAPPQPLVSPALGGQLRQQLISAEVQLPKD